LENLNNKKNTLIRFPLPLESWITCRCFCLFYFLFSLFLIQPLLPAKSGEQDRAEQLVRNVTLVDKPEWIKEEEKNDQDRLPLPELLILGIDMERAVFFKLIAQEGKSIVTAGELTKGMNMIALPTDGLFLESGIHMYTLEVKTGEIKQEKKIKLDIRIESSSSNSFDEAEEQPASIKPRIYEVSMYVGRKHIGTIQKTDTFFSGLFKDALNKKVDHNKNQAPLPDVRTPSISISPLAIAVMAYKAIKKHKEKKKREKIQYIYPRQITGGFYRKDLDGKVKPLDITIKLNSSL
jgi:hypothetical protein